MSIDKNQVKKVAKLSRISLDERKLDSLSKDLDSILSFVDQLNDSSIKLMWEKTGVEKFDIIIDDGLHSPDANINTLRLATKLIKKGTPL